MLNHLFIAGLFTLSTVLIAPAQALEACDASTQAYETIDDLIDIPTNSAWTYDVIPTQCIETSMDLMDALVSSSSKFKPYAYCQEGSDKPVRSKIPLCRSEKLVQKIQMQFQLVMDCLDIPAKAIFPLINVESGFYPNAAAPGGEDTGIGQVTPIAALDVDMRWSWLEDHIQASPKASCKSLQPLLPTLKLQEMESAFICKMIDPAVNPLRNSLYTGYIFLLNSKYYSDYFLENDVPNRLSALMGRQIESHEVDEIIHLLNILTYNMGFEWMRSKFAKYLETQEANGASLDMETFDYKNFHKDSFIGFLKKEDSSRYIKLVIDRNNAVEQKLGQGTCSEFKNIRPSSALEHMIWHPPVIE